MFFYGEYTKENKKRMKNSCCFLWFCGSMFAAVVFCPLIVLAAIGFKCNLLLWMLLPMGLTVIVATISPYLTSKKTVERVTVPKKIYINEDKAITVEFEASSVYKEYSKIRKIIDYGDRYIVKLHFPKVDGFLIQKDLIKNGTIEEFETLFADKIIRKI